MSRSRNSRKGSKKGNWKCGCCKPRVVNIRFCDDAAKREGRLAGDYSKRDNDFKIAYCDWPEYGGRHHR